MAGCGSASDSDPIVPEIVSIEINGADVNGTIHAIVIDDDLVQLSATVLYDDNTSSDVTYQLEWESNNTNVLTVHNGLLTPVANGGSAAISASFRDKIFTTADKNITVVPLTDINITSEDIIVTADETNATLYHADVNTTGVYNLLTYGTFEDNLTTISPISSNIQWTSSNTTVATIDSAGHMTVNVSGFTDINVSVYNEVNTTLELNVTIQ